MLSPKKSVNRVFIDSETSSDISSFAQNFLSTTEDSEVGLSEHEMRKRTDPQLLKTIAGPDLSPVLSFWGRRDRQATRSFN